MVSRNDDWTSWTHCAYPTLGLTRFQTVIFLLIHLLIQYAYSKNYIPITPQDAIFNHPSCGKFENVLQSKKLEILQVFLRFFSIRTFQLLAIWMLKSRILRCNGYMLQEHQHLG